MGFFRRTKEEPAANGPYGPAAGRRHGHEPYSMVIRPSFGQWLRVTWLDIATMIVLGAVGLGVYMADPAPSRSFAVTFPSDGEVVYPQFAYPLRKEIVPIWLAAFLATVIPIVVILAMQVRIRSFWDANNAIVGLLYGVIVAAVFQVFIKWLIGGLRPHFLAVCQPDLARAAAAGRAGGGYNAQGFQQMYYTREVCTGDRDQINDSLESMPSGHTTAAFAGFVYLSLYLNAKLKVFANYHPSLWKLAAVYAPVLGACLIGGALTIDEFHNWYDVLAGAVIGTVMAFSAYRMCYAAVWDWRYNHIPLSRVAPLAFADPELAGATFTHRVGWGTSGALPYTERPPANHGYGGHGVGSGVGNGAGNGAGFPRKPVAPGVRRGDEMV